MSADTAPAAMPGDDIERILRRHLDADEAIADVLRDIVNDVQALSAKILAEKERSIANLTRGLEEAVETSVKVGMTWQAAAEKAEARALAAEAALAGERERCEDAAFRALESMRDEGENDIRVAQSRVAAAIRAQPTSNER